MVGYSPWGRKESDMTGRLHFTSSSFRGVSFVFCLLISWLQSPSAVILESEKIKSDIVSPSVSHEMMGPDAIILVF